MYKRHEKIAEAPYNASCEAKKNGGILLTAGWGSITARLTVDLEYGICEQTFEMPQPSTPKCEEVGVLKDASTKTDYHRSPTWKKKNTPQALSVGNKIR
jgi:hypothetical protein